MLTHEYSKHVRNTLTSPMINNIYNAVQRIKSPEPLIMLPIKTKIFCTGINRVTEL